MKKILLKSLTFANWRGQNREIKFNDGETQILGRNECGKTSIMYAWFWLMSGYTDEALPKNSSLFDDSKPVTKDTPQASVTAVITIDGTEWALKRGVSPKFVKDKETGEYERASSDVYEYEIDGVPLPATKFNEWIEANVCNTKIVPYCLYGAFFSVLSIEDKTQARSALESIVGEVTDEDLTGDYSLLSGWLAKGYDTAAIEKSTRKNRKELDDSLAVLNASINLLNESIEKTESRMCDVDKQINEIQPELNELDAKLASHLTAEESVRQRANVNKEIADINHAMRIGAMQHRDEHEREIEIRKQQIDAAVQDLERIKQDRRRASATYQTYESSLSSWKKEREELVELRNKLKAQTFEDAKCEYCGQPLPEEKLEELKNEKMKRLENVISQGKKVRNTIDTIEQEMKELAERMKGDLEDKRAEEKIAQMKGGLAEFESSYKDYKETDEYKELEKKANALVLSMPEYKAVYGDWKERRKELQERLYELNRQKGAVGHIEENRTKLASDIEKRDKFAAERMKCEQILGKCREYNEEKANVVSARVNDKLKDCQIRMYEVQKNGELSPSCTITDKKGVRLLTVNQSKRVLIEAELQMMFCEAVGIQLPIFIDEASRFDDAHRPHYEGWQSVMISASNDPYLIVK